MVKNINLHIKTQRLKTKHRLPVESDFKIRSGELISSNNKGQTKKSF